MKPRVVTPEYVAVASWLRDRVLPWRRLTIAIDGVDDAGKSSLGRFLAWQLGMPVIEADWALQLHGARVEHDKDLLGRLLAARHNLGRPVLIEGIFVLRALSELGVDPDFVIGVKARERQGSRTLHHAFGEYMAEFDRAKVPDYEFSWEPSE